MYAPHFISIIHLFFLFILIISSPKTALAIDQDELVPLLESYQIQSGIAQQQGSQPSSFSEESNSSPKKSYIVEMPLPEYNTTESITSVIDLLQPESNKTKYVLGSDVIILISNQDQESFDQLQSQNIPIRENFKYSYSYDPNDTWYSSQWHLNSINYSSGANYSTGDPTLKIAVIDSGFSLAHNDLSGKTQYNTGENPGDFTDNDSNGFVDDYYGCAFKFDGLYNCSYSEITNSFDASHGTFTMGIIAATTNNGIGVAAVCPECKVIPIKLDLTYELDSYNAIRYAADRGAKVINLSSNRICPSEIESSLVASAMSYAESLGATVVQSAGNNGSLSQEDCLSRCGANPLCYDSRRNETYYYEDGRNVNSKLSVGSIDSSDARSSFSNYDVNYSSTDVSAPGEDIYSTDYLGGYEARSGTSFSAPIVSGALAMRLSKRSRTPSELKTELLNSSSVLSTDYSVGKKLNLFKLMNPYNYIYDGIAYYVALPPNTSGATPVHRFSRTDGLGHFYTASEDEKNTVILNYASTYSYDGIAFYVFVPPNISGSTPVYRFSRTDGLGHFYTASESEKNNVVANYSSSYNYDGIAYYVKIPPNQSGYLPVYRFSRMDSLGHFYTASETEKLSIY